MYIVEVDEYASTDQETRHTFHESLVGRWCVAQFDTHDVVNV